MIGVSLIVFFMLYISPGDAAEVLLGENTSAEALAQLRHDMGLDKPFFEQYFDYMKKIILHGDFGTSWITGKAVLGSIWDSFKNTVVLATFSELIAVTLALLLGVIAAVKQYSLFDSLSMLFALLGLSMPNFWQGLLFMLLFSVTLGWLPISGFTSFKHMILPALTIGTSSCASIARITRSCMLEVIRQDYIDTARAKGQKEAVVIFKHALKNAMIPVLTSIGLSFGALLGGSVITESVFSIPGLGALIVASVKKRDYPVVQGGILFIAFVLCVVNLLVDLMYVAVDPRMKTSLSRKG